MRKHDTWKILIDLGSTNVADSVHPMENDDQGTVKESEVRGKSFDLDKFCNEVKVVHYNGVYEMLHLSLSCSDESLIKS